MESVKLGGLTSPESNEARRDVGVIRFSVHRFLDQAYQEVKPGSRFTLEADSTLKNGRHEGGKVESVEFGLKEGRG